MTGSNVAEQLQRCSTITTLTYVPPRNGVGAEDAIEEVVRRQGAWHFGSGQRYLREIETLGRSFMWTEEGLELEASDRHVGIERGIEQGRQRSSQGRGDR